MPKKSEYIFFREKLKTSKDQNIKDAAECGYNNSDCVDNSITIYKDLFRDVLVNSKKFTYDSNFVITKEQEDNGIEAHGCANGDRVPLAVLDFYLSTELGIDYNELKLIKESYNQSIRSIAYHIIRLISNKLPTRSGSSLDFIVEACSHTTNICLENNRITLHTENEGFKINMLNPDPELYLDMRDLEITCDWILDEEHENFVLEKMTVKSSQKHLLELVEGVIEEGEEINLNNYRVFSKMARLRRLKDNAGKFISKRKKPKDAVKQENSSDAAEATAVEPSISSSERDSSRSDPILHLRDSGSKVAADSVIADEEALAKATSTSILKV